MKAIVERFQYLMDTLPSLLSAIPEKELNAKTGENKWTKKQILGHLVDSAANNHQRFIRVQYEDIPAISYDPDQWNILNRYDSLPVQNVIDFWTIYNQHLLQLMKNMPADQLEKKCMTGGDTPLTLKFIMEDYVHHLEHHLKQITNY